MSLAIRYGTPPVDTAIPENLLALFQMLQQYADITGDETLTGITIGSTEPSVDQQSLAWLVQSSLGRALYLSAYSGGWSQLPTVLKSLATATLPTDPQSGEVILRTDRGNAVEMYVSGAWRAISPGRGATADRPSSVPDGYRFYDTDIQRELRYDATNTAWTTSDGAVGEVRMSSGVAEATILTLNPGWSVLSVAGRVPYAADGTIGTGATGGRTTFPVVVTRGTDAPDNNTGANYVTQVAVDGTSPTAPAGAEMPGTTTTINVPINPLAFGVIFIKKDY